ncbi:hypothetical protein IKN40_00225 [bacterium]|nr:hypothetical protein [bacterium]
MCKWHEDYNPITIRESFKDLSDKERDEKIDEKFLELVDLINAKEKAEFKPVDNSANELFHDEEDSSADESKAKK